MMKSGLNVIFVLLALAGPPFLSWPPPAAGSLTRPGQLAASAKPTLERKLHGTWRGKGPCDGELTLRADGTYERRLHGPGGNNSSGRWEVLWDALPPTLVLNCTTSDDPTYIRQEVVKVVQLDDEGLAFRYAGSAMSRFARVRK